LGWHDQENSNSIQGDGLFIIGHHLADTLYIPDGPSLVGQIIVNADNDGGGWQYDTYYWDGSTIEYLAPKPYYVDIPAVFGGAVGLVPYHLYDEICTPSSGSMLCAIEPLSANDDKETVILTHYGPIVALQPNNTVIPYVIMRQSLEGVCDPTCHIPSPVDVSSLFKVTVGPSGSPRDVWVYPKTIARAGTGPSGPM